MLGKIVSRFIIIFFIYVVHTNLFAESSQSTMTSWLLENQEEFDAVIRETSRDTQSIWYDGSQDMSDDVLNQQESTTESSPSPPTQNVITHEVLSGETIYSISRKYNITQEQLKRWNNIGEDSAIFVGDILDIFTDSQDEASRAVSTPSKPSKPIEQKAQTVKSPTKVPAVPKETPQVPVEKRSQEQGTVVLPDFTHYKIVAGDTISSVAKKHGMSVNELIKINNISKDKVLTVDEVLMVRANYDYLDKPGYTSTNTFTWPIVGRLLTPFGPQAGGVVNEGINIGAKNGARIKATRGGIITYIGSALSDFGNIILIQHEDSWVSVYAHLNNIFVQKGQRVRQNEFIATVGNSGRVQIPQLHFELRKNVKAVDPLKYLNSHR